MSDSVTLGSLSKVGLHRDAIHIAVAPVVASEYFRPGQHVGVDINGVATTEKPHIGIVDPFLGVGPNKGQRFYLCLYTNSVTGMRHQWEHPAFVTGDTENERSAKQESEQWLRDYATRLKPYVKDNEKAFFDFISEVKDFTIHAHGTDLHSFGDLEQSDELREHLERYLGIRIRLDDFSFTCSC